MVEYLSNIPDTSKKKKNKVRENHHFHYSVVRCLVNFSFLRLCNSLLDFLQPPEEFMLPKYPFILPTLTLLHVLSMYLLQSTKQAGTAFTMNSLSTFVSGIQVALSEC